jgi:hypothetical protein
MSKLTAMRQGKRMLSPHGSPRSGVPRLSLSAERFVHLYGSRPDAWTKQTPRAAVEEALKKIQVNPFFCLRLRYPRMIFEAHTLLSHLYSDAQLPGLIAKLESSMSITVVAQQVALTSQGEQLMASLNSLLLQFEVGLLGCTRPPFKREKLIK